MYLIKSFDGTVSETMTINEAIALNKDVFVYEGTEEERILAATIQNGEINNFDGFNIAAPESDRLTDNELSPVAKREIALVDRLLLDSLISRYAYLQGTENKSVSIAFDGEDNPIAVEVESELSTDEINGAIAGYIDRSIDPDSRMVDGKLTVFHLL